MTKFMSTPYIVLLVVLGGITITTVLAQSVTITYPYTLTDGTNQRFIIASTGNVGIGNTTTNPPGLLTVKQLVNTNLGGIILQNTAGDNMRFWVDSSNNGYITIAGSNAIAITPSGVVYFPFGNVGVGTSTPVQKLDVAGNMHLTGNVTATPTNELTITTTNSKDICIGSC